MTTDKNDLPEWWDTFCVAVRTRTLDNFECRHQDWGDVKPWHKPTSWLPGLIQRPNEWEFRKYARTVRIEIEGKLVELVAPVLAGDVEPRDAIVWTDYGKGRQATEFQNDVLVFTSAADRAAMRSALLGVKP